MEDVTQFDLQPTLCGDLMVLRPLGSDDFEALCLAASDPRIWQQHPHARHERKVFEDFFSGALASGGALVAIDTKSRAIIGCSRYYDLDIVRSEVAIGFTFLTRECWGGVYNREMKRLMLNHAFQFVNVVLFHVDAGNVRSQKAIEKIGGSLVGQLLKPEPGGVTRTVLIYKIFKGASKLACSSKLSLTLSERI
jgi:RimJ/RimL family protein N-acetyltransferase